MIKVRVWEKKKPKTVGSEKRKEKNSPVICQAAFANWATAALLERLCSAEEIGRIDTGARSRKNTQKGNASDELSSVVFFDKFD